MKESVHPRPAKPDPPLKLNVPKPTFMNAKQDSTFGFKSRVPPDTAPGSDVEMEHEGVDNAEEHVAEENFNHENNGESHSLWVLRCFIILPLKFLLLENYDEMYVDGSCSFTFYITMLIQIRTSD